MKRFPPMIELAAALAVATPALAHEDGLDARGTVVEISAGRIVLKTPKGETRSFVVDPGTEVRRGKAPAAITDVATGEKAVVHAKRAPGGGAVATSVRLSSEPPAQR